MFFSLIALAPILAEDNTDDDNDSAVITTTAVKEESSDIKARQLMSSLEKILTPEQIKNFTNIVKQGNSLYGVRKLEMTASGTDALKSSTTVTVKDSQSLLKKMEKIAAPWLINQYEQIRKVGTALWGLKKENQEQARVYINAANSACVLTVIQTKDEALKVNNEAAVTSLNAAISTRTTCQTAAINATAASASSTNMFVNQKTELNLCVKAFNESAASIKKETTTKHKAIWGTYKTGLKACQTTNTTASSTDSSTEDDLMIEDGGGSIFEN